MLIDSTHIIVLLLILFTEEKIETIVLEPDRSHAADDLAANPGKSTKEEVKSELCSTSATYFVYLFTDEKAEMMMTEADPLRIEGLIGNCGGKLPVPSNWDIFVSCTCYFGYRRRCGNAVGRT